MHRRTVCKSSLSICISVCSVFVRRLLTFSVHPLFADSVALSCIVNTIDEDNSNFYREFESIKAGCLIPNFFEITASQRLIIDTLKSEFGSGRKQSLSRLRRFCSRRHCDIEEQLEGGLCTEEQEEILEEEKAIVKIMEHL